MLAGYLPFDDDPANPEGDNINLLYKYIVNTPLTFPEYVTPHARDLLRRILVSNPRKRADLFEVARHSWLSEYAHVVEFITSGTSTAGEIQNVTVSLEDGMDIPTVARSASVREAPKKSAASPSIGGLASKHGTVDPDAADGAQQKAQRDNKRRTVQVEYVAPSTATQRGEPSNAQLPAGKTRARSGSQGPVEVTEGGTASASPKDKPLPRDPPVSRDSYNKNTAGSRRPPSTHLNNHMSARAGRETRAITDNGAFVTGTLGSRPQDGSSTQSSGSRPVPANRSSYAEPVPPGLADTNVHGRIQQPQRITSKNYDKSSFPLQDQQPVESVPPSMTVPSKLAQVSASSAGGDGSEEKGHKRSSTMSELGGRLFGRSGSIFGGKNRKRPDQPQAGEKNKKYPPVSMINAMPSGDDARQSRQSMDSRRSRRSFSIGLGKKRSGSIAPSQNSQEKPNRRFSFIPTSFSFKSLTPNTEHTTPPPDSQQDLPIQQPPEIDPHGRYIDQDAAPVDATTIDVMYEQLHEQQAGAGSYQGQQQAMRNSYGHGQPGAATYRPSAVLNEGSESSYERLPGSATYPVDFAAQDAGYDSHMVVSNNKGTATNRGMLQKNKKFTDAWDGDEYSRRHDHSGSSGPARKVMDFFRRRGKARVGDS